MISPAPSEAGDASKEEALYTVSVAAQLVGMHAQTLRQYDRLGLVSPRRTAGRGRRYTARDVQKALPGRGREPSGCPARHAAGTNYR